MWQVAESLRMERLRRRLTIVQVARAAGLAPASIGKFERGAFASATVGIFEAWAGSLGHELQLQLQPAADTPAAGTVPMSPVRQARTGHHPSQPPRA